MPGGGNVRGEKDRVGKDQGGKDLESRNMICESKIYIGKEI